MSRARWLRVVAVGLVAVVALVSVSYAAPSRSQAAVEVPPEALLAAGLQSSDLAKVLPSGTDWWPLLPQFNSGLEPLSKAELVVVQEFKLASRQLGTVTDDAVIGTVSLFARESGAKVDYARRLKIDGGQTLHGPRVPADQWHYSKAGEFPSVTTTLRWRVGPLVGRISGTTASGPEAKTLAALFMRLRPRLAALLAGRLRARELSARDLAMLPPASAAPAAGIGTTRVPAAAWAAIDLSEKPFEVRSFLENGGASSLLFRRYLAGTPGNVVEVVLFPFDSTQTASDWVQQYVGGLGSSKLDPGATGDQSGFGAGGGDTYELQFAKGRFVGDVTCFGMFDAKTSTACEGTVRKLAERWYAALPQS